MNTKRRNFRLASGEVGFQKGFLRPALGPKGQTYERTRKLFSALFETKPWMLISGVCIVISFAVTANGMLSPW